MSRRLAVIVACLTLSCDQQPAVGDHTPRALPDPPSASNRSASERSEGLTLAAPDEQRWTYGLGCREGQLRLLFSDTPIANCERGISAKQRAVVITTDATSGQAAGSWTTFSPERDVAWFPGGAARERRSVTITFDAQARPDHSAVSGVVRIADGGSATFRAPLISVSHTTANPQTQGPQDAMLRGQLFGHSFDGAHVLAMQQGSKLTELRLYRLQGVDCSRADRALHVSVSADRVVKVQSLLWSDKQPILVPFPVELPEHLALEVDHFDHDFTASSSTVHGRLTLRARWGSDALSGRFRAKVCQTRESQGFPVTTNLSPLPPVQPAQPMSHRALEGLIGNHTFVARSALAFSSAQGVLQLRLYSAPAVTCATSEEAPYHAISGAGNRPLTPKDLTALPTKDELQIVDRAVAPYFDPDLGVWMVTAVDQAPGALHWTGFHSHGQRLSGNVYIPQARLSGRFEAQLCPTDP